MEWIMGIERELRKKTKRECYNQDRKEKSCHLGRRGG
jgi:hypothetical protein